MMSEARGAEGVWKKGCGRGVEEGVCRVGKIQGQNSRVGGVRGAHLR